MRSVSPSRARLLLAASWLSLLAACAAPSEEEVEAEFDAFVARHNQCELATDCALVNPGCPLGCNVAVRSDAVDAVLRKAAELIDDYRSDGRGCAYRCTAPPPIACAMGRCSAQR